MEDYRREMPEIVERLARAYERREQDMIAFHKSFRRHSREDIAMMLEIYEYFKRRSDPLAATDDESDPIIQHAKVYLCRLECEDDDETNQEQGD